MNIRNYEIVDHGIEHEQYFQGCGVAFTKFDNVATGIGTTFKEALEDAAEQLASAGYEIPDELWREIDTANNTDSEATHADCGDDGCPAQDCHYYASIRVRNEL